jgi:phage FluMu gp28-like protein
MQQVFGEVRVELVDMRSEFWLTEAPHLKARFEDGRIEVPRDRDVAADLRGVQVKGGVPFIPELRTKAKAEGAQKGAKRHCDAAAALILASAALRPGAAAPFEGLVAGPRPGVFETASNGLGGGFEGQLSEVGYGVAGRREDLPW